MLGPLYGFKPVSVLHCCSGVGCTCYGMLHSHVSFTALMGQQLSMESLPLPH